MLPKLEELVRELQTNGELPEGTSPSETRSTGPGVPITPGEIGEGNFVSFTRPDINRVYSYRVVAAEPENVQVVMMWRDLKSQCWAEGRTYLVSRADIDDIRLLQRDAPRAGDPF